MVEDAEPDSAEEIKFDYEDEDVDLDMIDHVPVRDTRTLQDVYERCNVAVTEPCNST